MQPLVVPRPMANPAVADSLSSHDCAKVLKAIADSTRLRILRHLIGGEKNVSQLVDEIKADQPSISHHLSLLRHAKLVMESREGKNVYYRINPAVARHLSSEMEKIDLGCCSVELRKE